MAKEKFSGRTDSHFDFNFINSWKRNNVSNFHTISCPMLILVLSTFLVFAKMIIIAPQGVSKYSTPWGVNEAAHAPLSRNNMDFYFLFIFYGLGWEELYQGFMLQWFEMLSKISQEYIKE